jgi:hypothetical protein
MAAYVTAFPPTRKAKPEHYIPNGCPPSLCRRISRSSQMNEANYRREGFCLSVFRDMSTLAEHFLTDLARMLAMDIRSI